VRPRPGYHAAVSESTDPHGLASPETRADPYPVYARMQQEDPVYFCGPLKCWLVTRYDDALACFRDPRLSADRAGGYAARLPPPVVEHLAPLLGNLSRWALLIDPPDHTRIRKLLNRAFTPRVVEGQRAAIAELCEDLLDAAEAHARAGDGTIDLVEHFAYPLPVRVIGGILGLPPEDGDRLKQWSDALAQFMGGAAPTPEVVGRARQAVLDLEAYFREAIEDRRAQPRDDLLSELVAAHEQGDRLGEQELLSTCSMLLFGGHETTTNLIANAVLTLLRHPEQLEHLRADPEARVAGAVEEVMRYEAPVQRMGRVTREAIELRGQAIAAGEPLYLMMGAANRDPERFTDPTRFDIERPDANKHLTLGLGAHFCVGAALGRMEGQLALTTLLRRWPSLALATAPERLRWIDNLTVRGREALPVQIGA